MRRMMGMMEAGRAPSLAPQKLEVNGRHPIIRSLAVVRQTQPALAKMVAKQVFSNALITAGLLDDPRTIVPNLNSILAEALQPHAATPPAVEASAQSEAEPQSDTANEPPSSAAKEGAKA